MKFFLYIISIAIFMSSLRADNLTREDIGKILFIKNHRTFQQEERFLVLDEILPNNKIRCHHYGKSRKFTVYADTVSNMHIYEGFTSFQITQYAFFAQVCLLLQLPCCYL